MQSSYFVVIHVATGQYMPIMPSGRGYSFWQPGEDDYLDPRKPPRLFNTRKDAENVIKAWTGGPRDKTVCRTLGGLPLTGQQGLEMEEERAARLLRPEASRKSKMLKVVELFVQCWENS